MTSAAPRARLEVGDPQPLQHVPVLRAHRRWPSANDIGQTLGHRGHLVSTPSLGRGADLGVDVQLHRRGDGKARVTGSSAAPVASARAAGPAGIRAVSPKNDTSTPDAVRSRSASRQTPPRRAAAREDPVRRPLAAGQGQHLHAERLAERHEPVEQLGRLEPFRDGGERHAVADQPRAGLVPVAHVRQGQDHAAAGGPYRGDLVETDTVYGPRDRRRSGREAENLVPVTKVGTHALRDSTRRPTGPTTRDRLASSRRTPLPRRHQPTSAMSTKTATPSHSGARRSAAQPSR